MSYIQSIQTSLPENCYSQSDLISFYQQTTDSEIDKRKIKIIGEKTAIKTRYSVIKDFGNNVAEFTFFAKNKTLEPMPTLDTRMELYQLHALNLALDAVNKIPRFDNFKHQITHIITVTCTGLFAPGLDIDLVRELNLNANIQRNSVNFMGCNAAILALKNADAICKSNTNANVLIVCVELTTLHFQKDFSDDYLLSNSLFSDGCAAVIVSSNFQNNFNFPVIQIQDFHSVLLHEGKKDMAWRLSDKGFLLNLSSYISKLINGNITKMLNDINIQTKDIQHWAIHPGGKKILDDFAHVLNLDKKQLIASYNVLENFGNMSSPTILFVLKEMIENNKFTKLDKIFTAAFGPGLSIESVILKYV